MLLKFPAKARETPPAGLEIRDRQDELDTAIREVDVAIAALRSRKRVLLAEYQRELRQALRLGLLFFLLGIGMTSVLPIVPPSDCSTSASTIVRTVARSVSGKAAILPANAQTP